MTVTLMQTLGLREDTDRSPLDILAGHLRARHMLLVLDNFEQVLEAAPDLAVLLIACPQLKLLVTSRAPLRLRGEHEWAVPPLPLPARGGSGQGTGNRRTGDGPEPFVLSPESSFELMHSAAVALFVERAQAARRVFVLDEANAAAVGEICRRLDGLPLAIELAAPWVRLLPPSTLLERLTGRLPALGHGARDLPERQQTLRATVGWSYDLLTPAQQTLFRRLAVFRASASLTAIEAICAAADSEKNSGAVVADLGGLTEQSLLRQELAADGLPRYTMLETVREYAAERLSEVGESETPRRHARFFLAVAERAEVMLRGPEQALWQAQLEQDQDNLRAALAWALEAGEAETALRRGGALGQFWELMGYLTEGRRSLELALHLGAGVPALLQSKGFCASGSLAVMMSDLAVAQSQYEEARRLGNDAEAAARYGEKLALFQDLGNELSVPILLGNLGYVEQHQGDFERSRTLFMESLALFQSLGAERNLAWCLEGLAGVAACLGQLVRAARLLGAARTQREAFGSSPRPVDRDESERNLRAVRMALSEESFAAAWAEGAAMSQRQAVTDALTWPNM